MTTPIEPASETPVGLLPQVLRARGKNNTLYDINRAADFIEAALAQTAPAEVVAEAEAQARALAERAGIDMDDFDMFIADLESTLIAFAEWTNRSYATPTQAEAKEAGRDYYKTGLIVAEGIATDAIMKHLHDSPVLRGKLLNDFAKAIHEEAETRDLLTSALLTEGEAR